MPKPMDAGQIETMNLNSPQPVVPPDPDEEVREYTVQHTLISLPDGRYLNAGAQVNSDDLRGGLWEPTSKKPPASGATSKAAQSC